MKRSNHKHPRMFPLFLLGLLVNGFTVPVVAQSAASQTADSLTAGSRSLVPQSVTPQGTAPQTAPQTALQQTTTPSAAVQGERDQKVLDLESVRTLRLQRSSALQKAGIQVDSAQWTEKAQVYQWLPAPSIYGKTGLSYGGPLNGPSSSSSSSSVGVTVTQTIWDGGKNGILVKIDRLATASARLAAKTAVFTALQEADTAYYGVLEAQDGVDAAQGDWDAAQESLLLAQAKMETGNLTPSALLKAQADVASASASLDQARRTLKTAQAKLASLVGLDLPINLKPIDLTSYQGLIEKLSSLDERSIETLVARLEQVGEQNNGDLASQVLAVQQAELDVQSAKSAYWPSISASWSDSLNVTQGGNTTTNSTSGSLQLTATLPLDLWNVSAETGKKKSAQASAALDLAEQRRNLLLDIRSAVYTWISSARSILSSKTALEYAQSNYETVLESYKLSLLSATDLSTATQLVSTNRSAYNRAHYDFLQGITDLKTLTALESEEKLLELVP